MPSKARTGLYAALLFAVDGGGCVLSLQLGSGSRTRAALAEDVARLRSEVARPEGFRAEAPVLVPRALRAVYDASLSPYAYEIASVWAAPYACAALDDAGFEERLYDDLLRLLETYGAWAARYLSTGV